MIKVRIGGWPFHLPQTWDEVSWHKAKKLYGTASNQIRKRLEILAHIPNEDAIQLPDSGVLAAYEILTFIEDTPELVGNYITVPEVKTWSFQQFELCRQAMSKHPEELALCFARITEILFTDDAGKLPSRYEKHYIEAGAKAMDALLLFVEQWKSTGLFDGELPSPEEERAGIKRLQSFGVYNILEQVAEKYGKLPREIEKESCQWVLTEWLFMREKTEFLNEMQKQMI